MIVTALKGIKHETIPYIPDNIYDSKCFRRVVYLIPSFLPCSKWHTNHFSTVKLAKYFHTYFVYAKTSRVALPLAWATRIRWSCYWRMLPARIEPSGMEFVMRR